MKNINDETAKSIRSFLEAQYIMGINTILVQHTAVSFAETDLLPDHY